MEEKVSRIKYSLLTLGVLVLLLMLSACGQDTPITLEAGLGVTPTPPASETAPPVLDTPLPDPGTVISVPVTPRGTPLGTAVSAARRTETTVPRDAQLTAPACMPRVATLAEVPPNFPGDVPLPPGLQVSEGKILQNNPNYLRVVGYAPLALSSSVRFLLAEYAKAGYKLSTGDSEPGEAEGVFDGKEWRVGVVIRAVRDCAGATQWLIVAFKVK